MGVCQAMAGLPECWTSRTFQRSWSLTGSKRRRSQKPSSVSSALPDSEDGPCSSMPRRLARSRMEPFSPVPKSRHPPGLLSESGITLKLGLWSWRSGLCRPSIHPSALGLGSVPRGCARSTCGRTSSHTGS